MLRGRAKGVLDGAAVEAVDCLELVEGDDDGALALGGESPWQREHLVGETIDVACRRDQWERDGQPAESSLLRLVPDFGARRCDGVGQPRARAVPLRFDGGDRARVSLEEGQVRAVAADGDVD